MPISKQEIIDHFKNYIQIKGGSYSDWYIGIGRDPEDLFFHMQNWDDQCWTYKCTYDPQIAMQVLDYFINTFGTEGAIGSANTTADIIYIYKKKVKELV
ncbi:MAG: hypothetical protein ACYS0I_05300 [Planctomycetota bacterium]